MSTGDERAEGPNADWSPRSVDPDREIVDCVTVADEFMSRSLSEPLLWSEAEVDAIVTVLWLWGTPTRRWPAGMGSSPAPIKRLLARSRSARRRSLSAARCAHCARCFSISLHSCVFCACWGVSGGLAVSAYQGISLADDGVERSPQVAAVTPEERLDVYCPRLVSWATGASVLGWRCDWCVCGP